MEIDEALITHLLSQSALTNLISDRIYPNERPQDSPLPAVIYLDVSDVKAHTLTQQSPLERPMKQFTVYASSKSVARAVAQQIKLALVDFQGELSGLEIQKIELQTELAGLETIADGTIRTFLHDLEFQINFIRK